MKKRVLSLFLALALCLTLLPGAAWAADNVAEVTVNGNTTPYSDIDAAFEAAQEATSATVTLLADVTISHDDYSGIKLEKGSITLDLNGKTLSKSKRDDNGFYAENAVFWLSPPGASTKEEFLAALQTPVRLTVQDGAGGGKIVQPNGGPAIIATLNTILTVNGGTVENTSSVDQDTQSHMAPNCAVLLSGGGKAVINGGKLSGMRGVAVTGYITKEAEDLYKEYFGIEGYNNDTYGNELTVTGGEISGTSGEALIVYEKAKKIELSGGTFTTQSNEHSIWVDDTEEDGEPTIKGDAASLLKNGCRYEYNGTECAYSTDGNGVVGNTEVKERPANEYTYIDADGNEAVQANCTEITTDTTELTSGWYAVNKDVTISGDLSVTGPQYVNLILCDGAALTVTGSVRLKNNNYSLNIYGQSEHTGTLKAGSAESTVPAIVVDESVGSSGYGYLYIYGGTVTVQAKEGTYSIGETSSGQHLDFETGEEMKTVRTDDPDAYLYWYDKSGVSLTITKCKNHVRMYKDRGDWHSSYCALCSKDGGTATHNFNTLEAVTETTHTYSCVCGASRTDSHTTLSESPNADGLTHTGRCGICTYSTAPEKHNFQYSGMCICFAYLTASYGGQNYASLSSAVAAAAETGGTVTLERDVTENITITDGMDVTIDLNGKIWTTDGAYAHPTLTVKGGSVTVKNGTLETGTSSNAATTVVVEGGSLTVGEDMIIQGAMWDVGKYRPAIEVAGGELTLPIGTKLVYGMKVSAEGKTLADYLPEGTAFVQIPDEGAGSFVNGYVQELTGNFTLSVEEHNHSFGVDNTCACGFVCEHTGGTASYFQKKVCTICGAEYGDLLEDTTAPTGSITIEERTPFRTFIKTITFGLFFKEDVTATVTATDDSCDQPGYDKSKHAVKIEYLVSNQAFTEEELKAQTFTDYTKAIDLTDEQNYVVYARLTDHAGNETYLSTDGFVIDKTAPSINDFADGQEVHICSSSYTVSVQDDYLKEVTVDGVKQTGDSITFYMAESGNPHTVVAEDWAGNTSTVKFTLHGGHNYNIETGECENNCGAAAEVRVTDDTGTHVWEQFGEALRILNKSTTPVTVTLLKDCRYADYTQITKNELTVDLNGHSFGNASDRFCVAQLDAESKCKLTITGEGRFEPSILLASGSTLTVDENVTYVGGIESYFHTYFGDKVTDLSVTLKGGKYGAIDLTYQDNDGNTQTAGTLCDLLAPGYVFTDSTAAGSSSAANVGVVPCTNHIWDNGVCSTCKLPCTHNWSGNKCTVCNYVCSHSSVEERDGNTYCITCNQQMVVKVEKDGTTTYYAERHNSSNDETLWWLFNNALESGSTVTLLADDLFAWAYVSNDKTITLDLNGKTLTESFQGITVGQGDSDDTSTDNKLIVKGTLGDGEAAADNNYAFRTWVGGELDLEDFEGGGKIGGIIADGGKVTTGSSNTDITIGTLDVNNGGTELSFSTGTFDKITGNNNKKLGDLLRQNSGCAFQYEDGEFVLYNTLIGSNAVENVKIVTCTHDSVTNGTCDYCNLDNLAAALIAADGTVRNYFYADESDANTQIQSAIQALMTSDNGKVKLFADCEYADKITWEDNMQGTIDLNGHNVTYTGTMNRDGGLLMLNSGTLTITDSSTDKTGSFAYVMVKSGASLIADGAYVKQIFANESNSNVLLKAGSKFKGINLGNSRLFNCLDEGCCISRSNCITATMYAGDTPLTVMQIPGTVTPPTDKNVSISYGSSVPDSFRPTVTLDDGVEASLTYKWLYRASGFYSSLSYAQVTADGQPLDMICVITAWSGGNAWETAVTGYKLTVSAADLKDATVTATNANRLIFTPDENGDGQTQTLKFTVTYQDQYTMLTLGTDYEIVDSSNAAADAGEHTLTLRGKGNYTGTLEYKWTVKQRELTGISDLSKPYDGTTALPDITFDYDGGAVTLTEGEDYTVTGSFDSADAGDKTVSVTVTLKNKNYTFADEKTEQTFMVDTQITKAAVSGLKNVSQTIRCAAGVKQSFMPELTSFGIPAGAQIQDISGVTLSDGAPVTSYGSEDPGVVYCTLSEGAKVGDTFSISFFIESKNYQDAYVTIDVTLIDRDTPTVSANDITVTYNGSAVSAEKITGTSDVAGTWSWKAGQALTDVADSGKKTVVFTPNDTVNYKPVETEIQVTINKKDVTVKGVTVSDKTYDGKTDADVSSQATLTGAVEGDSLGFTVSANFEGKNVGTQTAKLTVTLIGEDAGNYQLSAVSQTTATAKITAKEVTLTGGISAEDRSYEANNTDVTLKKGTLTFTGLVGSETLDVTLSGGTIADANAGENKPVTYTVTLSDGENGGKAGNYKLVGHPDVTVTISRADPACTAPTANTLTYTGEAQTLVTAGSTSDGTVEYSTDGQNWQPELPAATNAGVYTVYYRVVGDNNHTDKEFSPVTVTITKREITVRGIAAKNRDYDGTTAATLDYSEVIFGGKLDSDDLTVTADGAFENANAGKNKTVSLTNLTLSGAAADNYVLAESGQQTTATAEITAKEVTLTGGVSAEDRSYEANNTDVTLKKGTLTFTGLVGSETLDVTLSSGTIADANAGENKPVTYTVTLTDGENGGKAGNYKLVSKPEITVTISRADPACTAPTANTLTYSGEAQTLVTAGSTSDGRVEYSTDGQNWQTALPAATNAGVYTVYYRVVGDSNHTDKEFSPVTVTITKQPVAVPAADTTAFTYNGEDQTYTIAPNDNYTVAGNVWRNAAAYNVTVTLNDTANYVWSNGDTGAAKNYAFTIAPKTVTVTVMDKSAYVGSTAPDLSAPKAEVDYKVEGLLGDDELTVPPTLAYAAEPDMTKEGETEITASGADAGGNYEIDYVPGKLTVSVYIPPVFSITVAETEHGSVSASPVRAERGQTVTLTVTPDDGYTLETLTVTDRSGNALELTDLGDGKYSFTMPAGKADVQATFMDDNTMLNFFVDVKAEDYFYDAVLWAVKNGITNGTDELHFSPNAPCTRAQIVTFLWRAAGEPAVDYLLPFTDVESDAYYAEAVRWAASEGIVKGTSDTTFSPDDTCTRAQITAMLWRRAGQPVVNYAMNFTDVEEGAYYAEAVRWAASEGITSGTGDGTFSPDDTCTRAQVVTFLRREAQEK